MQHTTNKQELTRQRDEWSMTALSTLTKLCNIIGFLPIHLDDVLKAAVNETFALFSPQSCSVYLVKPENRFELAAYKTADGGLPDAHVRSVTDSCIALRDGLPHIGCISSECGNRMTECEDASYVCIPLTTGSDVNGVLSITLNPGESLSRDRLNVLLSIANQMSAAIQRHRLFETLSKEKQEIERAYRSISDLNNQLTRNIDELKMTQARLIQSEKLAATGELSAGLCHEINNPIGIILNRIECLKMEANDLSLSDTVIRDLDVIYAHAAKVSTLVQDLLIFSRHHSVEFRPVLLAPLFDRVIADLQSSLVRGGCRVLVHIPSNLSPALGDGERLEQVFRNLVANAVDAMPDGGTISIDADRDNERGGAIVVRVRDEGEGISEQNLLRIFDPFFTTKKLGKGSGLGLPISYGIIKSHGGEIRAASRPGRGSTFTVSLPASDTGHGARMKQ